MTELPTDFDPLREQLLAAAEEFASDATPLGDVLVGLVEDVERATHERLEIVPVCHHSPSSALHLVQRLQREAPRVIFLECCEDLRPLLDGLRECTLPVALQAFAARADAFPSAWAPLNLVCPLSEFSAEFQAIAFCLNNPKTELVFVDRAADHVFQWMPQESEALENLLPDDAETGDDAETLHGSAVGVEIGSLLPSFDEFRRFLLKNARVQHFSEWYDQYVEEAIIHADYETYRQVMFLVGSLFRRLGTTAEELQSDEIRERFMWTRIKQHLRKKRIPAEKAIYICGAAHAASRVEEFGVDSQAEWEIPLRTDTEWLYGLLPSSYGSIELQFGHPRGAITLAEARWKKALTRRKLKPFRLQNEAATAKKTTTKKTSQKNAAVVDADNPTELESKRHPLLEYLQLPPAFIEEDQAELLTNSVKIVNLARKNGYLASTADSIAVYQTSILLANMRNRRHPTPYDFRDAAMTCIEKGHVPGKRDVSRLCDILLGGDRTGKIGYQSLPPLAQDVQDRLAILPVNVEARTIQRALLDFRKNPEYLPASDLLWKLRYLLAGDVVRPIMGQRELGHVPQQESWDLALGKNQTAVIQLGYEGVTVEHVLERRLKKAAFGAKATTATALQAAEDSLLFLDSERLTEELGERATSLLVTEPDVKEAPQIYARITRLVHYYRTRPEGMPPWCEEFVTTGYSHYATLLPNAFTDRGVTPANLAVMLQFIFTLESLALSLGCERSQLVIAIKQSADHTTDFPKLALLWSAEVVLRLREISSLREKFDRLLDNELTIPSIPEYLGGFLLGLSFTPLVSGLTVELMSKAFERLPDQILMPWLPKLLMMLRSHANSALPTLLKEVESLFPSSLEALKSWEAPWNKPAKPTVSRSDSATPALTESQQLANSLLRNYPVTTEALASLWNLQEGWSETTSAEPGATASRESSAAAKLLQQYPATAEAAAKLFE